MNFFLVLACFFCWVFGALPGFWSRRLWSHYIVADVQLTSSPYHFLPTTPEKPWVVYSLPPNIGGRDISFPSLPHMSTRISDLQFLPRLFLTSTRASARPFRDCLDIYLFHFNFLWADLRYVQLFFDWHNPRFILSGTFRVYLVNIWTLGVLLGVPSGSHLWVFEHYWYF